VESDLLEKRRLLYSEDGDHDRFSHYARKADIARASVTGEKITAICGKRFVPTRDPNKYPICPSCVEVRLSMLG
jgi:hypothetical protein